jgi:hypothetical protein
MKKPSITNRTEVSQKRDKQKKDKWHMRDQRHACELSNPTEGAKEWA